GRAATDPVSERVEIQAQNGEQPFDAGLHEELVIGRAEARKIEHERLVAPGEDVVRRRIDLVREGLPAGGRLADLEQEPGGEDGPVVEAGGGEPLASGARA